ncbi:TPA: 2,3-diaminopropionate biosynthesis protein SbnB [Bacillus cereus]
MIYLNKQHIERININWNDIITLFEKTVYSLKSGDYSQPIKPYLKFEEPNNRIIAMPAFIGSNINASGLKWIASFPDNLSKGFARAHSVTVLNDVNSGRPLSLINTAHVSAIRTAGVSGLLIKSFLTERKIKDINVGIIGFGPIGQMHLNMINALIGSNVKKVRIYDSLKVNTDFVPNDIKDCLEICNCWEDVYKASDIFITCTVSSKGYINQKPKDGALLLNVSLRDFTPEILNYTSSIIVDSWEEVCRENTDIEFMHIERGLQKSDTKSIVDIVCDNGMGTFPIEEAIMFNPMGMAVFDIATANHFYLKALEDNIGIKLED